ncbi:PREDICTED: LOW QUALITY PROTEIN: eukaryotic translation initiation factor 5B-like [Erythranthe guttata]|uniref:LOW QUALITY PROTEIN: eukaryotic translation initiation factor 5B-like n=1 Tax=Erythranthe guttata TaxID=4155 RepID=UPI00064E13D0|nr:PREDICTED: LOW QUALITY PROTEIN: eukaryotic translation initiation factor 5B-like [Erythranthe guttata]|eukprot:XP_012838933.1 PREDICTED: LOW QUALITY PROTEIN: eukaryotic translation initiation factor 5B-like [Erythranthe guttata]
MGRKKPSNRDEESGPTGVAAGGKSKKKGFMIDDDEYSMGTELSEEAVVPEEKVAPVGKQKKGKKGGSKKVELNDEDEELGANVVEEEDDDAPVIKFDGKKKSKGKKSTGFSASSFGLLGEDEEEDDHGRKDNDEEDEEADPPVIAFSGKKKPSKSKKSGGGMASAFDLLGEEEESKDNDESSKEEDEDIGITFTGKKKKSSKGLKKGSGNSFSAALLDEENDEEEMPRINFSGKKKSSKKKSASADTAPESGNGDASSDVVELDQHNEDSKIKKQTSEDMVDTSKNKKKKKKGGKTGHEEDDLDKILAELGVAPPESASAAAPIVPTAGEKVQKQSEKEEAAADKEDEDEGPVESVASKKKKKKKDKEKEKKAAASAPAVEETRTDTSNIVPGKKVPKHVREMQERIAKMKEDKERKEREEAERLRKEEEERLKKEEEEKLIEEKKRLKKEREKEKLLKKKQEGKLLTGKQKEEARRLEAMRNQILAKAGGLQIPSGETTGAPAKRPLYQKKKPKSQTQSNGASTVDNVESTDSKEIHEIALQQDSVEAENVDAVESSSTKDTAGTIDVIEENGVDDEEEEEEDEEEEEEDEEWDAKSWDDADLKLPGKSAFSDEEVDSEPEPLLKKEIKNPRTTTQDVEQPSITTKPNDLTEKAASTVPLRSDKKNIKQVPKEETPKSDSVQKELRSPICCIMGHVDTGKTKLLDCIRGTNVQEGEAGGITQQIGATYFPAENIRERTKELKADAKLNVPGLLVIDTPGHESFTNLRSRGSGLCEIAILVVDIMHGLEPQTIESLNLLKMRNTDFIVALNKVDRLYGWKTCRNAPIGKAMKLQSKDVQMEFNNRLTQVITQFKEQGLNTELYYKNKDRGETFNIVPTSAISGEGIPDMLLLLVQWTQKTMIERLTFSNEVECTVLEVKVVEGHGTTIDVVLVNGVLHEGDQIVVCGLQGPIVTTIRALLTPHPMKELRVKGTYLHHKEIKAAQGIKITAQGLEHAIAGTSLYIVGPNDDLEDIKATAMEDMKSVMSRIDKSGEGVYVQASTLGSLEALLEFLKTPAVNIPVSGISIGPVHKKDVMKASVMLEKKKEYATILAFDVKVTQEARELADELGVTIFIADIIYHLFDQFKAYIDNLKEERKKEAADDAVFPCVLKIIPNCVFNKKDPIVLGVDVVEGTAKIGTPLCVPQREFIEIGRIASIENNHKPVDYAKKGQTVAIKIIGSNSEEQQKMVGRHFEIEDELVSKISRASLDALKENYKDDVTPEETKLLHKLKRLFKIP